jgi:hypothetical protein
MYMQMKDTEAQLELARTDTYMHTYIHTYIHAYIHAYIHNTHMHTQIHAYMHADERHRGST